MTLQISWFLQKLTDVTDVSSAFGYSSYWHLAFLWKCIFDSGELIFPAMPLINEEDYMQTAAVL